jgi:succinoglycan biosynthesis protein ExoA
MSWPQVAVVMPIRNEVRHLADAVSSILHQGYAGELEICLAVAPSTDGTEALADELAARHDNVRVVANPVGVTPAGLNAAIAATSGPIIVRVDGHAQLSPGYITRAVQTLDRTGAVNVGGVQRAQGETPLEHAIAVAMTSPLGAGGARFHIGGTEGPVDTVYLGVFRRDALEAVGGFDETLIRNQDYELNIRLRNAGGVVWFDPELWVTYRPRSSLRALARQYGEYGAWKRHVLRRHPGSVKARQVAPVIVTAGVVGGVILGPWWRRAFLAPFSYGAAIAAGSALTAGWRRPALAARLCVVLPTMHLSWGLGFFAGERLRRRPGH